MNSWYGIALGTLAIILVAAIPISLLLAILVANIRLFRDLGNLTNPKDPPDKTTRHRKLNQQAK